MCVGARFFVLGSGLDGTHRGHLTASVHVTHHSTAFNVDGGVTIDDTCLGVVLAAHDGVGTATSTVHVTTILVNDGRGIGSVTDSTAVNVDGGVGVHMAVLAGTVNRTVNFGGTRKYAAAALGADIHPRFPNVSEVVESRDGFTA